MKRLQLKTHGLVVSGLLLTLACSKGGAGADQTPAASPSHPAPIAAASICPANVVSDHDAMMASCHVTKTNDQINVCISNEKGFLAKYPGVNCQINVPNATTPLTISVANIQDQIDRDTAQLTAQTDSSPSGSSGQGTGTGSGSTGTGGTTNPSGLQGCSSTISADYSKLSQVTHADGTLAGPCSDQESLAGLNTCETAYVAFQGRYPKLDCLYSDPVTRKTSEISEDQLEGIILNLKLQIDTQQHPPGSDGVVLKFCDAKSAADYVKMTVSCHESTAATSPAADVPRLKSCLAGYEQFLQKYPKENCKLPSSAGKLFDLIVTAESLNELISLLKEDLAKLG